jgi:hypothetical protein
VERAFDLLAADLAVGEGGLLMGAAIVKGEDIAAEVDETDWFLIRADLDIHHLARLEVGGLGDGKILSHEPLTSSS